MKRQDAEHLSIEQIEDAIELLVAKKADIDEQVKFAKRNAQATGEYSDPDWLGRSEIASKLTGRDIKVLQNVLGQKKRAEKAARQEQSANQKTDFYREFVKAAKDALPDAMFSSLVDRAAIACGQRT